MAERHKGLSVVVDLLIPERPSGPRLVRSNNNRQPSSIARVKMAGRYLGFSYSIIVLLSFANCQTVTRSPPADLDLLINEVGSIMLSGYFCDRLNNMSTLA